MELTLGRQLHHLDPQANLRWFISNPEPLIPHSQGDEDNGKTCIANISPRERLKRLVGGVIPFLIAVVILAVLISSGADRLWRLPLFLLYWSATTGFFQWRDKT
jgi:hypothetical protein